jgi:hypothetical protein
MTTVACAVFAGLTNVTDRQTDRFPVAIDRTLLCNVRQKRERLNHA